MINSYNPDVLTCLANLSSDEVFTPPAIANAVLDLLPQNLWSNKEATFLDPVCKSGVFLREIAKRLINGLQDQIPDLQERLNHIYTKQLYGIAITELTALLSRRTVYCSKHANSTYSVCSDFTDADGNIHFTQTPHRWQDDKCTFCGANRDIYERSGELETHAYQFIHTATPEELFSMKFDVIIGNPPYQLNDGGGTGSSAMPIYQKFVQQAKKLNPRYLTMIIPARWFSGGRGLDEFRDEMLKDTRIRIIHDFFNANDCFPGVEIKGGICYFLWDRDCKGDCEVFSHDGNKDVYVSVRPLLEKGLDTFIRNNSLISILKKVQKHLEPSFSEIVSANDPFGFDIREENTYKRVKPNFTLQPFENSVEFYYFGWRTEGIGHIDNRLITKNRDWINKEKILIPKAWGIGNVNTDWLTPFIVPKNSCCTETYLVIGPFDDKQIAENIVSYIQTKFFHTLLSIIKITQNTMKKAYSFVPQQDFIESWTDEKLYKKYELTQEEIDFIEKMVRPME